MRSRVVPSVAKFRLRDDVGACAIRLEDVSEEPVALWDLGAGGGPGGGGGKGIPGSQLLRGGERLWDVLVALDELSLCKAPVDAALFDDGASW